MLRLPPRFHAALLTAPGRLPGIQVAVARVQLTRLRDRWTPQGMQPWLHVTGATRTDLAVAATAPGWQVHGHPVTRRQHRRLTRHCPLLDHPTRDPGESARRILAISSVLVDCPPAALGQDPVWEAIATARAQIEVVVVWPDGRVTA